jgi:hypothetical protein
LGAHNWERATCTTPRTCKVCALQEGKELGHRWKSATCTEPKTCSDCGTKSGEALGHDVKDYICSRCETSVVTIKDLANIISIENFRIKVNSVGGIDVQLDYENRSDKKTIEYLFLNLSFYDGSGKPLTCRVSGKNSAAIYDDDWVSPGNTGYSSWKSIFYNGSYKFVRIDWIGITYRDGTKIVLDKTLAQDTLYQH